MPRLIINGRYLTQSITGVQRYAHEIVRAIDVLLEDCPGFFVELLSPPLTSEIPTFKNIIHRVVGHTQGHFWDTFIVPNLKNTFTIRKLKKLRSLLINSLTLLYLSRIKLYGQGFLKKFQLFLSFPNFFWMIRCFFSYSFLLTLQKNIFVKRAKHRKI